jgi:hypothetical protein
MTDRMTWLRTRVRAGALLVLIGVVLFAASLAAQQANPDSTFNFRIIGGLGIALAGAGLGVAVKYAAGLRDEAAGRRLVAEELDERSVSIRRRAAARAYWLSAALVFGGLMWTSFASNGQLPAIEGDTLWNFLALATILPFGVYAGSIVLDERRG